MSNDKRISIITVPCMLSAADAKAIGLAALTAPRTFEATLANGQKVTATETPALGRTEAH